MKKEPDHITTLILNWQKTGKGFDELFREASCVVLEYPEKHYRWEQDQCAEFYLFFYDRLLKLIKNFEYRGASFNALLNNTISWQINSFYRQNRVSRKMNYCLRYNCILEAEEAADPFECVSLEVSDGARVHLDINNDGVISDHRLSRKLLMLVLKNSPYLDDVYINKITEITGCSKDWLTTAVLLLRGRCEVKRKRMEVYSLRTNKAYMELCQVHRELGLCENNLERIALLKRLDVLKARLDKAGNRKKSVLMTPTNAEVADIMGIPKGSIDSGLHHLKKILQVLAESDDDLNQIAE